MTGQARKIDTFLEEETSSARSDERPKFLGHLLVMPLTNGKEALIAPDKVNSVSDHRSEPNVTVIRQDNDSYTYFVACPYEVVKRWLAASLDD